MPVAAGHGLWRTAIASPRLGPVRPTSRLHLPQLPSLVCPSPQSPLPRLLLTLLFSLAFSCCACLSYLLQNKSLPRICTRGQVCLFSCYLALTLPVSSLTDRLQSNTHMPFSTDASMGYFVHRFLFPAITIMPFVPFVWVHHLQP